MKNEITEAYSINLQPVCIYFQLKLVVIWGCNFNFTHFKHTLWKRPEVLNNSTSKDWQMTNVTLKDFWEQ